ncbi:hypothetical protein NFI96_022959, partial [Prochilodus magdalenae]
MSFPRCPGAPNVLTLLVLLIHVLSSALAKRHVVYWNSTNPSDENHCMIPSKYDGMTEGNMCELRDNWDHPTDTKLVAINGIKLAYFHKFHTVIHIIKNVSNGTCIVMFPINWVFPVVMLTSEDYSVQVNLNDYLDILCPHYPPGSPLPSSPETLALYLVAESQFRGCQETKGAIKRWECNNPQAPYGPVRFSEKIQRFTPFSLGFEFLPGHHYYYS